MYLLSFFVLLVCVYTYLCLPTALFEASYLLLFLSLLGAFQTT